MIRKIENKPRKINAAGTAIVQAIAARLLDRCGHSVRDGLGIYCVNQRRGMHWARKNYITVPNWALINSTPGFEIYYVAHELAHAIAHHENPFVREMHGQRFMEIFKQVCPIEHQYHEYGYKPRAAKAAGVARKI